MRTFMENAVGGKYDSCTDDELRSEWYAAQDAWQAAEWLNEPPMNEFLGVTWDEFYRIATDVSVLRTIIRNRRLQQ